ncbi:helix-turn-helix transcriptional regulator, partial [Nocardioides sp.]|uniref:helix-turn-helix transcriptional regulator n=1 Tax=Nocardioides sp. TaxID=35761 RepID=UPI002B267BC1
TGVAAAAEAGAALPFACDQVLIMQAHAAMASGALDEAVALGLAEVGGPRASPLTATAWSDTLGIARSMTGQLTAATQDAADGRGAAEVIDPFGLRDQAVALEALIGGMRGLSVAVADLERLRARGSGPDPRIDIWVARALAWSRSVAGDRTAAVGAAAAGGRAGVEAQHITWGVMALHDAVRLGDAAGAREVADDVQDAVRETEGAALLETMARHAVVTSAEDPEGLGEVATAFARHGAWLLAAEAQAQRALLLARSSADDRVVSWASVLSQIWEARCDGPCTPLLASRPPAGLTARQLEIAQAAARGASSAEIAEGHVLSVRTVDNHLGKVYRVLGLVGRDELAARIGPVLAGTVRGERRG